MRRRFKTYWFKLRIKLVLDNIHTGADYGNLKIMCGNDWVSLSKFINTLELSGYYRKVYYGNSCIDFKLKLTEKGINFLACQKK